MEDYLEDMTEHKAFLILERTRYLEASDYDPPEYSSSETDQDTQLSHLRQEQGRADAVSADPLRMSQEEIYPCTEAAVSENEGSMPNSTEATGLLVKEEPGNNPVVFMNQVNFLVKEECIDSHESWQESLKTEPTSPLLINAQGEDSVEIDDYNVNWKKEVVVKEEVPDSSEEIFRTCSAESEDHDFSIQNNQPPHINCSASCSSVQIASSSSQCLSEMVGMNTRKCSVKISSEHGTVLHQSVVGQKKCSEYGKAIKIPDHLTSLFRTHSTVKPYKCSRCGKSFAESSILTAHMRKHPEEQPFKCSECGASFRNRSHLTKHMPIHAGNWPYKCSLCGKPFVGNTTLRRHMILHTADKPFKCSQCGESFVDRSQLVEHMCTHPGDRPYKCSQCWRSYKDSNHLTAHMRMHMENRPFKCSQCGKSFLCSSNLTLHMQIHTRELLS